MAENLCSVSNRMEEAYGAMVRRMLAEIEGVLATEEASAAATVVVHELAEAARKEAQIILYGVGREGLMMKGLTMRLFHLGLPSSFVGDMTTPAIKQSDLFLLSAGPGSFSTVEALASVARSAGARVLLLTAQPSGTASRLAHVVVHVPAQTMANDNGDTSSILPMGSLYEGALYGLFEIVVLKLSKLLNIPAEDMRARHTNLE